MAVTLPGPFHYEKPSDFGKYGDLKYYRSFNSTISWEKMEWFNNLYAKIIIEKLILIF